ncbi:tetratricopeptide repeat protein [Streptosporangium sp. NBC_01495]|uniref:tetratricopeptide repeat protein n=1 Tax=Streptosporangium sp. NBC_01495 TaxID=2903899 RepID=UPI002E2EC6CB|nr:tetratricopeptide repeat protein [Streptosporangium sp. NBC_01495]
MNIQEVNNLPRKPTGTFVGRNDALEQIEKALLGTHEIRHSVVICGLGGVGKSELALHYAEKWRKDYKTIWWVAADSVRGVQEGLANLAMRIYPQISLLGSIEQISEWALSWFQSNSGWLLILDNVEAPADVKHLLAQLSSGHIIVTTRRNVRWPDRILKVPLNVLTTSQATGLVIQIIEPDLIGDSSTIDELVEELGHLPLALDQASAYINQSRISASRYLELLVRNPSRTYNSHSEERDSQETIARVWKITLERLQVRNPIVITVLKALAHYAPYVIPRILLTHDNDVVDFDETLGLLASYSLIDLKDDFISMHRLLRSVLLISIDSEDESQALATIALFWIRRVIPADPDSEVDSWPLLRSLAPHLRCLADQIYPSGNEPDDESICMVLNSFAAFERVQGNYESAFNIITQAFNFSMSSQGEESEVMLIVRNNRAAILWNLGRRDDALSEILAAGDLADHIFGRKSLKGLMIRRNIASMLCDAGHFSESEIEVRNTLDLSRELLGERHPQTLACHIDLAAALHKMGRIKEASNEIQKANIGNKDISNNGLPEIIYGRKHQINIFRSLGNFKEAESETRRLVDHLTELLGDDHPETLTVRDVRACTLGGMGFVEKAVEELREVLELRRRALGDSHPDTLTSLSNLASFLRDSGQLEESEEKSKRVVELSKKFLGEDHADTLISRNNLANLLSDMGRHEEAEREIRETVEIRSRVLGVKHPETLKSRNNLAVILVKKGKYAEAAIELQNVVEELSEILGKGNVFTLKVRNSLVIARLGMGQFELAETEARGVVEAHLENLGENHPQTQESFSLLDRAISESRRLIHGNLSRNAPCLCGSRKKVKRCCGKKV